MIFVRSALFNAFFFAVTFLMTVTLATPAFEPFVTRPVRVLVVICE